jgi:hypothetical protein
VRTYLISIIPDLSTRALWQLPAETSSSKAGELDEKWPMNVAYEVSLFKPVGFFNMP